MRRFAALLRALNVGGHTVTMSRLRSLFEELDFANVETLIASGNVLFDAQDRNTAAIERRIERHLETALGYAVATFLRTPDELTRIATAQPFTARALAAPGVRLFVAFLGAPPPAPARNRALALRAPTDDLTLDGREIYWLCRVPMNRAAVTGAVLEKALGMPVTVRNVTTVRKLAARI
jgi:uncharacterized protein (DUF1697 family)